MNQEELSDLLQHLLGHRSDLNAEKLRHATGLSTNQLIIAFNGGGTAITLVKLLKALGYDIFALIEQQKAGKKTELEHMRSRLDAVEVKLEMAMNALKPSNYFTQKNDNEQN